MKQEIIWKTLINISKTPLLIKFFQTKPILKATFYLKIKRALSKSSPPVLVYQMGKVASSTIYQALIKDEDFITFHVHRLNPVNIIKHRQDRIEKGWQTPEKIHEILSPFIYNNIIKSKMPIKIITLVRDPISRNISDYFQVLDQIWSIKNAYSKLSLEELTQGFFEKHLDYVPLTWFDLEFKEVLDVDVYKYNFPQDKGYLQIKSGCYDILIMKHNLDDQIKQEILGQFLGKNFSLVSKNVADEKGYADTYRKFLATVKLPESYVNKMLDSKYTQHFYSNKEINKLKEKWLKKT